MTDDAELRARIEAQVAARRAGGSPSKGERGAEDDEDDGDGSAPSGPARGPGGLAPTRPWSRTDTPAPVTPAEPPSPTNGPVRPWLRRGGEQSPPAAAPPEIPVGGSSTGLTPARPWNGRGSSEPAEPSAAKTPAPSNPEIVLQSLAAELPVEEPVRGRGRSHPVTSQPPSRRRRLGRRPGAEDETAAGPAEPVMAIAPEPASDPELVAAAEPEPVMASAPQAEPLAAEETEPGPQQDDPEPVEGPRSKRALRWLLARAPEPEAEPASAAQPEPFPQPTPEPYPQPMPEPMPGPTPEPQPVPTPEPPPAGDADEDPTPGPLAPGTDLPRRLAEAAAADGPPLPLESKRPRFSRRRGRRAEAEDDGEPYEQFTLPEPDQAFEQPWLGPTAPSPTRPWERSESDQPAGAHQPDSPPSPDPAREPVPEPTPEPVPEPTPEPTPAPTPEPEPAPLPRPTGRHRPSPGAAAGAETAARAERPGPAPRPRPAPYPQPAPEPAAPAASAASAASTPSPAPSPAPAPARALGIAGATPPPPPTGDRPAAHRSGEGISGAAGGGTDTARRPDIARFLEAAEPRPGDHEPEAARKKSGPRLSARARRSLVRGLVVVLIAAVATWLLRAFVVQPYYIPSESMEPTLHGCTGCTDDHVLVDKLSYRAHDVRAGDIVVFHRPPNVSPSDIPDKILIKRVIALPHDIVELKRGHVFVNGLVLDEPYVKNCGANPTAPLTTTTKWTVPGNDVFVMGDNRCHSEDSRAFGPIATSSIIGRAFAIIWPFGRIGLL